MFSAMVASDMLGALVFITTGVLLAADPRLRHRVPWFILSYFMTAVWALMHVALILELPVTFALIASTLLRNVTWSIGLLFLFKQAYFSRKAPFMLYRTFGVAMVFCLLISYALPLSAFCLIQIFLTSVGLCFLEQIYRNAQQERRGSIKFFCIGLAFLFANDFYQYVNVLYRGVGNLLPIAPNFVDMLVLWGALSGLSTRRWAYQMSFSRMHLFPPFVPIVCLGYMLVMGVEYYDMQATTFLEILVLLGGVGLAFIALSRRAKRWILKKDVSRSFFKYRYDYREEWSHFSHVLYRNYHDLHLQERVIISLANMVDSPGGVLYERQDNQQFHFAASWGAGASIEHQILPELLTRYMEQTARVINMANLAKDLHFQKHQVSLTFFHTMPSAWLVIPLIYGDKLHAVLVLTEAYTKFTLNWEVFNLLKIAGSQAAGCLVQAQSAERLAEAKQFEGFNKLATFVLHDLKNVGSQLSLILKNAELHRHNRLFMDGVFETLKASAQQMEHLISQINTGRLAVKERFNLISCVQQVVQQRSSYYPIPQLLIEDKEEKWFLDGDQSRFLHILTNLIENAQEATRDGGDVRIILRYDQEAVFIEVMDTGRGMDEGFIRHQLFKPFVTTKGATGMGIGVFEAKEYMRMIGGEVRVRSAVGKGAHFSLVFPITVFCAAISFT